MNRVFISDELFGKLIILNVYEYFDQPRIFSAQSENGALYFIYWIGDTEKDVEWYIIPVEDIILKQLESFNFDIRHVLTKLSIEFFYKLSVPINNSELLKVEKIQYKYIEDLILIPNKNVMINPDYLEITDDLFGYDMFESALAKEIFYHEISQFHEQISDVFFQIPTLKIEDFTTKLSENYTNKLSWPVNMNLFKVAAYLRMKISNSPSEWTQLFTLKINSTADTTTVNKKKVKQ